MSRIVKFCLCSLVLSIASCSQNYTFNYEQDIRFKQYNIKDTIGIAIRMPQKNDFYFYKDGFGTKIKEELKSPEKPSHENSQLSPDGYSFLPESNKYKLLGPQLTSPDNTRTVVSCVQKGTKWIAADIFLIFDNYSNKYIFTQNSYQKQFIKGVAWSPDSQRFVLLTSDSYFAFNWNILANLSGHFTSANNFYLSFYTKEGQLLFTKKIISKIKNSSVQVTWFR